jgi:hypothetical protein
MITSFKRWKELYESRSINLSHSILEEIQDAPSIDKNALLIKLLGNPATRKTVYKRINAALSAYISNPENNPSTLIVDLNKMNPDARMFFDDEFPPKVIINISNLVTVNTDAAGVATDKLGGLLNVFKNKKQLSEGWVGVGFTYSLDITIDEIVLNSMFESEDERKISGISGIGLLRGHLVESEELDNLGKPKYITEWELVDMGINFSKSLDEYTFACKSISPDQLVGKKLASGEAILAESAINVNEFTIKKGERSIYGPTYFLSSQLFAADQKTFKVDLNDV